MAKQSKPLTGPASLRYCIAKLTKTAESKLPRDEGTDMMQSLRRAVAKTHTLKNHPAYEPVASRHIGLFSESGAVSAVILQGNKVVDNPTAFNPVTPSLITGRILVEKTRRR